MEVELCPHPDHPPGKAKTVHACLEWAAPGRLNLRYRISAPLDAIALPPPAMPRRTDGLWKTTCLEFFIQDEDASYQEFNFSPSSEWAAYQFAAYRQGMTPLILEGTPEIALTGASDQLDIDVELGLGFAGRRRANLTAVIEERDGTKSYWALSHPPEGPPDFHHPACFTLELPPAPAP